MNKIGGDMTMCDGRLKVIARSSRLSVWQVKEVFSYMEGIEYDLIPLESYGDKHKEISLMDANIPADFFTREMDAAVLDGTADVAIHSAKDLPFPIPKGLEIYALMPATDKTDSLISKDNLSLRQLPAGAKVATSSFKRKQELLKIREDLAFVSVRGTIEERIAQLDNHDFDALIVATCALQRLNLSHRITERLPMETHPLQGHIAVVGRKDNATLKDRFSKLGFLRLADSSTRAFYLEGREVSTVARQLLDMGVEASTPARLICSMGNDPKNYHFFLNELNHTVIHASEPVLMLVGDSINVQKSERRVLVTGTSIEWGASRGVVTHTPLIYTQKIVNERNTTVLQNIDRFDYIVFTSRHGVKCFLEQVNKDDFATQLAKVKLISVGSVTTQSLNAVGLTPEYESDTESAEGIIHYFKEKDITGKKILLPRSSIGITTLPRELEKMGNEVVDLPIYETLINTDTDLIEDMSVFNEILFSSPSGIAAFKIRYGRLPKDIPLTCKGKTTEKEMIDSL
ncbi:MAG: hydroxymethylbilane synthase [Paludibacteraceae bacterium]|nr:hydroxymethylbilane synthase [Paludibacteraceae bacterium]